jgi:glycine/sarcosine N-methyltransferase
MKDTVTEFYQELAPHYDQMTRFQARFKSEEKILREWIKRYEFKSVLDVACGTGLHAIILSTLGIKVVGSDISPDMLKHARHNAAQAGVKVKWVSASMQEVSQKVSQKFDAIFCLGNSLPHLLTIGDLHKTVQGLSNLLNDSGILVLQMLNYDQLLKSKKRIVGINREKNREFIRFYDFLENLIRFNILTIDWKDNVPTTQLTSTLLHPYTKGELNTILAYFGFTEIEYYGDLKFSEYRPIGSPNLLVVARKNSKHDQR